MDMTILTSISEGQPLVILESFAAGKPVIATDVGNCRGLILGERDDYGPAGIITHIMSVEEIAQAMVSMAHHENTRRKMGEVGQKRVREHYRIQLMEEVYRTLYKDFAKSMGLSWSEDEKKNSKKESPAPANTKKEKARKSKSKNRGVRPGAENKKKNKKGAD